MALQAKNVQVAGFEQTRIRRTMRRVAALTTLRLNPLVLEDKRPLFVCVACEANRVPRGRRAQLLANKPAVRVMAI